MTAPDGSATGRPEPGGSQDAEGSQASRPSAAAAGFTSILSHIAKWAASQKVRWAIGGGAAVLAVWAVVAEWDAVVEAIKRLSPGLLALALVATVGNVVAAGLVWRTVLADLGTKLAVAPTAKIYFIGQLGKYLPGSVWSVVIQAELGSDYKVPRRRTATATVVALLISVVSAALIVLACTPLTGDVVPAGFRWAVVLIVPLAVTLHPKVFGALADRLLRLVGRAPLEHRTSTAGTILATLWAVLSWVFSGLQVWLLSVSFGAPVDVETVLLLTAGYALAWAVGFIVVIAPAGAGVREVALIAVLAPVLERGEILVVVLLSRVLFTAVDLVAAAAVAFTVRGAHPEIEAEVQAVRQADHQAEATGQTHSLEAEVDAVRAAEHKPGADTPLEG
jgi:uncharacterized membrane protein YbhN (UPF0104 family)